MPNDLYQWQSAGGLVHHCPTCFKPLTTPKAKSRCLGVHVEQCKRYHTQLFKKGEFVIVFEDDVSLLLTSDTSVGTSSQCDPCTREDEEHLKRHREIAELLRQLKEVKRVEDLPEAKSPLTPRALNTLSGSPATSGESTPSTKKQRKAAKKAKKLSELPQSVVTSSDIQFVASVLDPHILGAENEDVDLERQLLEDPDIKLNQAFHAGTSNRREIRNEFVVKDKRAAKRGNDEIVDAEEIAGLLQLLNVSPLTSSSSASERSLFEKLGGCIQHHLIHAHNENEALMMRKAGFWRWANKKNYKRLMESGRIRSQKAGPLSSTTPSTQQSASSSMDGSDDETQPDTDVTTPEEEDGDEVTATIEKMTIDVKMTIVDAKAGRSSSISRKAKSAANVKQIAKIDVDDGWRTVGKAKPSKAKPVKAPSGNITLVHNGGLNSMAGPVAPPARRRGFATSYDHLY